MCDRYRTLLQVALNAYEAGIIALPVRSPFRTPRGPVPGSVGDAVMQLWPYICPLHVLYQTLPSLSSPSRPAFTPPPFCYFHLSSSSPTWHWSCRLYRSQILPSDLPSKHRYYLLTSRQSTESSSRRQSVLAHELLQVPVSPIAVATLL